MRAYVVAEGPTDILFLKALIPAEIQSQTAFVAGNSRTNLASVARTLLVTRHKPLAVLADADSVDGSAVLERRRQMEELVREVSGGVPVRVFVISPEIETLLLHVPAALERITGHKLTTENLALARYRPGKVVQQLGQDKAVTIDQIVRSLSPEELNTLREASPIKELITFLAEHAAPKQQAQTV